MIVRICNESLGKNKNVTAKSDQKKAIRHANEPTCFFYLKL